MTRPAVPSQVRLILQMVALFVAVMLLGFGYAWWSADQAIRRSLATTLDQEIAEFQCETDPAAIAAEVGRGTAGAGNALALRFDPVGAAPVGDARIDPAPPGTLTMQRVGNEAMRLLVKTVDVAGGRLSLGIGAGDLDELSERFTAILLWTLVPACLMALGGGMLLARRSARRVGAIEDTLTRLNRGQLDARMPPEDRPMDDLRRIGRGLDRLAVAQQASVEALRQVSADIAHDLKSPLQRLYVLVEEARGTPDPARAQAALARASEECRGMAETFRALLEIAQLDGRSQRANLGTLICSFDWADDRTTGNDAPLSRR